MNKRLMTLLVVALTGLLFVTAGVLTAADVPEKITLSPEGKGYKKVKKGPVLFKHKEHAEKYKIACTECHHNYKDGKNVWKEGDPVRPCSECHKMKTVKKAGKKVYKLQSAYHKNCKNCHKALGKEGKKTGPFKKCNQCHEKKKK